MPGAGKKIIRLDNTARSGEKITNAEGPLLSWLNLFNAEWSPKPGTRRGTEIPGGGGKEITVTT